MITTEKIIQHHIQCEDNKKDWGRGPWTSEPNRLFWVHRGFYCLVVRMLKTGHLCGYVGVKKRHPLFAVDMSTAYSLDSQVHGGVTYAETPRGEVCIGKQGVFWLGFDCSHTLDFRPSDQTIDHKTYRNIEYVCKQTNLLADYLVNARAKCKTR